VTQPKANDPSLVGNSTTDFGVDSGQDSSSSESQHDRQLAALLSDMADEVAAGREVDFAGICQQYPELASDLRRLWGAVLVTDIAGVASDQLPAADTSDQGNRRWQRLQLPTTIGDYELQEEIGRGGMGVVFRAIQISLGRSVAVKMILRGRLASDNDLQRFLSEASATARLQHPHIVPVYEVGDIEGRPFFSMKLINGLTLSDRLLDGPMPEREAAELVATIARAIGFAHRQGIVHRDLKPSNILIDDDGTPMVSDFGLAKRFGVENDLTRSGMVIGTPSYMSPEQASGRRDDVGPASDIYSLGCVLYHALTGRPPLVAESMMELVMLVLEQDPTPPRALRPRLDRDLEMIVIRCLQKPADLRYETADELADDLEAYLRDEQVLAASGRFGQVLARLFRETHHATVLENWGVLWMWHALVLLVASLLTWVLEYREVQNLLSYVFVWVVGLGAWAAVFWKLRQRIGPVTFVERQVAHVWGSSMISIALLFPLEWWLQLPVLSLSPLLGVISASVFIVKAGMFSGLFYFQAAALLATAVVMAVVPRYAHLVFGIVAALCFFIPGYQYQRRRRV
jgi:serine/threonine-protein kinase